MLPKILDLTEKASSVMSTTTKFSGAQADKIISYITQGPDTQ